MHRMFWYSWPEIDIEKKVREIPVVCPIADGEQDIQQIATKIHLIIRIYFQDGL